MKIVNKIFQILAVVFGVGTVVMFFVPFANISTVGGDVTTVAAELAFGAKVSIGKAVYDLSTSAHILFVFCLSVIAALMSAFSFKAKGLRYSSSFVALVTTVYMWVIALSIDSRFTDVSKLPPLAEKGITHTSFVLVMAIVSLLFAIFAIGYLFIDDYIQAKATGGKTIWQRFVLFLRDNKSEVKKIVWPGLRDVIKNTVTVLVMCLVIGAIIWVIDYGLVELVKLISGIKGAN